MRLLNGLLLCIASSAVAASSAAADLTLRVIVTNEGRQLFEAWEANPKGGFVVAPVKQPRRGEFLSAVVFFSDCAADRAGNCDTALDMTVFDPSGRVYGQFRGQELWRGKEAPAPGHTQLGLGYMGLVIEPQDPAGEYRVEASVSDRVSGKSSQAQAVFSID